MNTPPNQAPDPSETFGTTPEIQAIVNSTDFQTQIKFIEYIIDNMKSGANKRIMITGDTGLGKTTFVKQFAKLLGISSVIVEIPHVVEEHLINIPFVVFDAHGQSSQGYDQVKKDGVSLELGTSYLASSLKKLTKLSDADYQAAIGRFDPFLKTLIQKYEADNPGEIRSIRNQYDKILFFDEYYRQTTPAIRNILRNVLNGRIGNDQIPKGTYVMYATNLSDIGGSIDQQSQHTSFIHKEYSAPTAEQWLNYTISRAMGGNIKIKKDVVTAFKDSLTDGHVSFNDIDAEIRLSPRRWSEIFLYINNAYPFQSPDEASIIWSTLQRQFQSETGTMSSAEESLKNIFKALMEKSGLPAEGARRLSNNKWREVLAHQVMTAMSVGEQKKYVPVLQGLPGVGKTAIGAMFENEPYNLRFIPILATTISRDSVVGIPLPDKDKGNGKLGVNFAPPELYIRIMNIIKDANEDYIAQLKEEEAAGKLGDKTARDKYNEYLNQKYKYLIFFDEINRVSDVSVFNSLRRLILEKEFNDQYKLPAESVIIAAMNPADMGTQPLTSHFRDAVDIIDVSPSWKDTLTFLKTRVRPYLEQTNKASDIALDVGIEIIETFEKEFTDDRSKEFFIDIGGGLTIYLSPRDYDNLYKELVAGLDRKLKNISARMTKGEVIEDDEIKDILVSAAFDKMKGTLDERLYQAGVNDAPGFMNKIIQVLDTAINVNMKKETKVQTLSNILNDGFAKGEDLANDIDLLTYLNTYTPAGYTKDIGEFLTDFYDDAINPEEIKEKNAQFMTIYKTMRSIVDKNDIGIDIQDQTTHAFGEFIDKLISSLNDDYNPDVIKVAQDCNDVYVSIALGK